MSCPFKRRQYGQYPKRRAYGEIHACRRCQALHISAKSHCTNPEIDSRREGPVRGYLISVVSVSFSPPAGPRPKPGGFLAGRRTSLVIYACIPVCISTLRNPSAVGPAGYLKFASTREGERAGNTA